MRLLLACALVATAAGLQLAPAAPVRAAPRAASRVAMQALDDAPLDPPKRKGLWGPDREPPACT